MGWSCFSMSEYKSFENTMGKGEIACHKKKMVSSYIEFSGLVCTDRMTDEQTNGQTTVKQYASDHLMWGHKNIMMISPHNIGRGGGWGWGVVC